MLAFFETFLGLIILLSPFLGIFCFKNRLQAFVYIFSIFVAFHLILAFLTQALGVFTYPVILSINVLFTTALLFFTFRKRQPNFKFSLNWFLIFALLIVFFEIWSVHYDYTGEINTITGAQSVKSSSYIYPYFSDEWVAVSLVNYSIASHSLPLVNPLWENVKFLNPMVFYFSFISEFFLILKLNPLTSIPIFAIASAMLVCFFSYLLLRSYKVGNIASVFSILFLPFIVNGANLPGLWYLMPFVVSFSVFLVSLISFNIGENKPAFVASAVSLALYPPIIIFVLPVMFVAYIFEKKADKFKFSLKNFLILFGMLVFSLLAIVSVLFFKNIFSQIYSFIFRNNLDIGIPSFAIWNVMPKIALVFSVIGIFFSIKKKDFLLLAPIIFGFIFWIVYAYTNKVFIIDYPRVVVITSFILIIFSGFGFDWIGKYLQQNFFKNKNDAKNIIYIKLFLVIIFGGMIFSYTQNQDWKKMVLVTPTPQGYEKKVPASPVNKYLNSGDLKLFQNISGKRFIAPPWKGLVIGVSTLNYPLESKASTITNQFLTYTDFLSADCGVKKSLAQKLDVEYVYSSTLSCSGFSQVGQVGVEGLILYKFEK